MDIHPVTLAFTGRHQNLETPFRKDYFNHSLRQVRIILLIGFLFLGGYSILDALVVPDQKHLFWFFRWGIGCPTILIILGFTYSGYANRFLQPLLCLAVFVNGLILIIMIMLIPEDKHILYVEGLVLILIVVYALSKIRFIYASSTFTSLILFYIICGIIFGHFPIEKILLDIAFLGGLNILGMIACYFIEFYTRKNFLLSVQLENQKNNLDIANQLLEKRVDERTAELSQSNQLLKNEIKERKLMASALRETEVLYRQMVNNITDYLCIHDLDGKIIEVNNRIISGLGYSHREIIGLNLRDLMVPEQQPNFARYLERIRCGEKDTGTTTLITKNNQLRLMQFSSILGPYTKNTNVAYCLARDITERQRAERALAESEARFKNIFETTTAGMMIVNSQTGIIEEINPAGAQMIGDAVNHIKGLAMDRIIHDASVNNERAMNENAHVDPVEGELLSRKKGHIPILKTMRPMKFNGQLKWMISFIDIQKVKEVEAMKREVEIQVTHSQHLQAIGTLAGGIAHDFNNILYGIIGYAQLALDDAPEHSLLHDNISEILQGSRRAKDLIGQIMAFSRQDKTEKRIIQLVPVIKEALKLMRASIPASIKIKTDIISMDNAILANASQIHQTIINLCTNAAHAMIPKGGMLHIRLDRTTLDNELTNHDKILSSGPYARLRVIDTGTGMSESIQARIFEPFFTTKPQGEGTGMGLSVVLGIVQAHEGMIHVESDAGKGSSFEILLPIASQEIPAETRQKKIIPGGTERILLVDDENSIIQVGRQLLTRLGYHVTTCKDPLDALRLFENDINAFDLVITDLSMPGIDGTELTRKLVSQKPDLPVIMCTGYSEQISPEQMVEKGIRKVIFKPILRETLASTIRRVLDNPIDKYSRKSLTHN